jgi:predicted deacetylase
MPETLATVSELLELLARHGWKRVTLLVVPGREWRDPDIDSLHRWQGAGHLLAGHGWRHQVDTTQLRGPGARLHSLFISRNVAEHLALDAAGILQLLGRCHRWFEEQGLIPPSYYVPPAWAMGGISRVELRNSPFRQIEYLSGIRDLDKGRFLRLPLIGFEADTRIRAAFLRSWNGLNRRLAGSQRPLRIAIHPNDARLRLAGDLIACLERFRPSS